MNFFQRFWGHLRTVQRHRKAVRKLLFKCGLYWQGLTHDLSKFSPTEFWLGVKYFTGTASPHVKERAETGYSEAWLHHHNRNKHHAEYWVDIVNGKSVHIGIPYNYLIEMVCDRVAASKTYLKDKYTDEAPLAYYNAHKDENEFAEETRLALENMLYFIATRGLDAFLERAKAYVKRSKNERL